MSLSYRWRGAGFSSGLAVVALVLSISVMAGPNQVFAAASHPLAVSGPVAHEFPVQPLATVRSVAAGPVDVVLARAEDQEREEMGLAPRFVGDFEKGIDYRGDLDVFRTEYLKHLAIADACGPYKISIHSGSDKFGVYRVIGELGAGGVHVKTAGTSYLEALRAVAVCDPDLFREILDFARSLYEHERRTYHVSGQLERVPAADTLDDRALMMLLDDEDARQVLHVTFGRVLTERRPEGKSLFKDRIMACLESNEDVHFGNLVTHFRRHTEPFNLDGRDA